MDTLVLVSRPNFVLPHMKSREKADGDSTDFLNAHLIALVSLLWSIYLG